MRPIILVTVAALGVAGVAAAQSTMSHPGMGHMNAAPGDAAAALPTSDYVMKSAASDAFEMQEGQMASSMARSHDVKMFGAMMVTEHRRTTDTLMHALKERGQTPPPPALSADQQAQIDQLRGLSGAEFDRAYVSQQLAAHHEALMVQADYAKGGSDAQLRHIAADTVPIVQGHLRTLATLQARINGAT